MNIVYHNINEINTSAILIYMALFVRQDENRTELQKRLAAELLERSKQRTQLADRPDGVEDSQYIKGTKTTTSLAWVWIVIILVAVGISVWLMALGISHK